MHEWGNTLTGGGFSAKIDDPSSTTLTYWTDKCVQYEWSCLPPSHSQIAQRTLPRFPYLRCVTSGAYYDFYAYEPNITSKGVPQDILEALADTMRNGTYQGAPLPVKMLMLDAYWMFNVRANGNCKVNDTVWPLPFPRGLRSLADATGWSLIIYNGPQCAESTYSSVWPLMYSLHWDQGWGAGTLSAIADSAAEAFYADLFTRLSAQGMGSFTQDFLDFQGLLFPGWLTSPWGNGRWLAAAARAAQAAGIAVQYCMALPSDILESTQYPAVTNARASDDYGVSGSNWRIGGSSLLLSALGMRASKDNFATGAATDRGQETSPFLVACVTALSHGPVGFSDALFKTNPAVLWPTMMLNGTILHASRPATLLDVQFAGVGPLASGDIRATHSRIGGTSADSLNFYTVLAALATPQVIPTYLRVEDLWPAPINPLPDSQNWLLWQFNNSHCARDGADAAGCVAVLGNASANIPIPSPASHDHVSWELWYAVPLLSSSIALLGEIGKFVAVSPNRFREVHVTGGSLVVSLAGAPFEHLSVAWLQKNGTTPFFGTIRSAELTLDAAGELTATL